MSILPLNLARVSNLLRSNLATESISQTQSQLLDVQNELSTGKRVNQPSDDPSSAAIIQQLQKTLESRQGFSSNINQAKSQLGEVDSTLSNLNDLLQQAQQIASQNVSSTVSADQRAARLRLSTAFITRPSPSPTPSLKAVTSSAVICRPILPTSRQPVVCSSAALPKR